MKFVILLIIILNIQGFSMDNKEVIFWNWFTENSNILKFELKKNPNKAIDMIEKELKKYNKDLFFEISDHKNEIVELIISASGNKNFFDSVESLVKKAPKIRDWKIIAFKQAKGFNFKIKWENVELNPKEIYFQAFNHPTNKEIIGLKIYTDKFKENEKEKLFNAIATIVDTGLGEYTASKRIDIIDIYPLDTLKKDEYIPLNELMNYINFSDKKKN